MLKSKGVIRRIIEDKDRFLVSFPNHMMAISMWTSRICAIDCARRRKRGAKFPLPMTQP
jgi:hypothetical protein